MSQSNEYLLRMRQQQYGATGNQPANNNNNNQYSNLPQSNTMTSNNNYQQNKPVEIDDPNSCGNLMCETWNLTLLIGTILSVAIIVGLIIAYK